MLSIIAAMDAKRGIGKDGGIPWHIPEDFRHFKELTMGHSMIMGRRTFESIGRILPGRVHVVITHDLDNKTAVENVNWASSLEDGINLAKEKEGHDEIFIIGGGQIYKEALERGMVDKMYLTVVDGDFEADTFFPEYTNAGFKEIKKEEKDDGKFKFRFLELKKINS